MIVNDYLQSNGVNNVLSKINSSEESKSEGLSFMDTLKEKLDEVNEKQIRSANVTEAFIRGENVDIHEVMIVGEEAKLSLQLAVQVRNKLVEAYQELNRMQL